MCNQRSEPKCTMYISDIVHLVFPKECKGYRKILQIARGARGKTSRRKLPFLFHRKSVVCHLRKSDDCREQYLLKYGPAYKTRIQYQSSKQERVKKRVGKYIGPSICNFCPAPADQRLLVHLRSNAECNKKYKAFYKENTEDGLRKQIKRENARIRKQKSRQRRNHK